MSVNMVAMASLATPSITVNFTNSKTLTSLLGCWPSSNSTLRRQPSSCALTLHCGAAVFASSSFPFTSPIPIQIVATLESMHSLNVITSLFRLQVMISGAPASGKGTQCELIKHKCMLLLGDLLRDEIATGSDNGKLAKQYMEKGQLVPDHIIVMMVKDCPLKPDAKDQ